MKASKRPLMLMAVFINEDNSSTFSKNGACVFHCIHRPCYGYLDTDKWQAGSVYEEPHLLRIPRDLPPGQWTLYGVVVQSDDSALSNLKISELEIVNYLNYDGYEQVYRLRYGQRLGEPYWKIGNKSDVKKAGVELIPPDNKKGSPWFPLATVKTRAIE